MRLTLNTKIKSCIICNLKDLKLYDQSFPSKGLFLMFFILKLLIYVKFIYLFLFYLFIYQQTTGILQYIKVVHKKQKYKFKKKICETTTKKKHVKKYV